MQTSLCAKHPHQPLGGVCASCLRERLAICMGSLGKCGGGGGGEDESASNEALGSSIILNSNGIGSDSPSASRDTDKRKLPYYLESIQGVSSNCNVHANHRKAISSDAIYEANSFYSAHHYVPQGRDDGSYLKGAKESPSLTKENPSKGRPFSWLSAFFSKREEKQKADSRECSIAPWRECSSSKDSCTHSFSSEPGQLSPWPKKHTTSPLKLSSLLSSQSTRPPLKLPRSPSMVTAPPLSSPLKLPPLRTSPRTPLKLPPLQSYPRSPLKLSSLLSSKPAIACDVESQGEEDQRSGHGMQSKRKEIWLGILMRHRWVVRFKRYFGKKKKQEEAESVRTSSARESDYSRHSQNHHLVQARHSQNQWFMERNQRSPMLNVRPSRAGREGDSQRWGSAGGRDYAGWESYFSNSFNGLQVRHRYHSADSSELLRFYLTPTIRSTYKLRSHHYY